jgi:hypothetical protein
VLPEEVGEAINFEGKVVEVEWVAYFWKEPS